MKQYCRYCANMICGDANFCQSFCETYSDEKIKRVNYCPNFEYCEIDARDGERKYKPRGEKKYDQLKFE